MERPPANPGGFSRVIAKTPTKRAPVTGDLVGVRIQPGMAKQIDDWRRAQDDPAGAAGSD
jgi:hypothetical protein